MRSGPRAEGEPPVGISRHLGGDRFEAEPGPQLLERREVAGALVPEAEVLTHHHRARPEASPEELLGEALRRPAREIHRERLDRDVRRAVLAQQLDAARQRGELRRRSAPEHLAGMWIEGEDHAAQGARIRQRPRLPEHGLMAEVHPVEVADHDDAERSRRHHSLVHASGTG